MKALCKLFAVVVMVVLVWPQKDNDSPKSEEAAEESTPTTFKRREFKSTKCRDTYTHNSLDFDVEIKSFKIEKSEHSVLTYYRPLIEYTIKKDDKLIAHRKVRPAGWNKELEGSSGRVLDNNNRYQFLRNHYGQDELAFKTISKVVLGIPGKNRKPNDQLFAPVDICITFDLTKGIKRTTRSKLYSSFRSAESFQNLMKER